MALGRQVVQEDTAGQVTLQSAVRVNTRSALWGDRWPAIALQSCIDTVEAAPPDKQAAVKRALPCQDCPENVRCLNAKRKELGPMIYDREILTQPRSQESTLFPMELFVPMLRPGMSQMPHYRKEGLAAKHQVVVSGWDLAWSEKVGGDRLVRTTAVLDRRTNKRRLLNIRRYPEGLRYTEQIAAIESAWRQFQDDLVVVESDAAQVIWAQELEESTPVPVVRHTAGGQKTDLTNGVPGLLIDFDLQRWEFPFMPESYQIEEMEQLLNEFGAFGWKDGKLEGVGAHDDMVMSFWHCAHGLKLMSSMIDEVRAGNQPGRSS